MKLISTTDFVIEQEEVVETGGTSFWKSLNYANFLKQILTLGMFVPCDLEGNVLTEPMDYNFYSKGDWNRNENKIWQKCCKKYQQAKERVVFEGWKDEDGNIVDFENCENYSYGRLLGMKEDKLYHWNGEIEDFEIFNTIEDLVNECSITLTPTAVKEIGL